MITMEQALTSREFHENHEAGEKIYRWRRNGATQTWKTRPTEFRIPVKYGMYSYDNITHRDADRVHAVEDCPSQ